MGFETHIENTLNLRNPLWKFKQLSRPCEAIQSRLLLMTHSVERIQSKRVGEQIVRMEINDIKKKSRSGLYSRVVTF